MESTELSKDRCAECAATREFHSQNRYVQYIVASESSRNFFAGHLSADEPERLMMNFRSMIRTCKDFKTSYQLPLW